MGGGSFFGAANGKGMLNYCMYAEYMYIDLYIDLYDRSIYIVYIYTRSIDLCVFGQRHEYIIGIKQYHKNKEQGKGARFVFVLKTTGTMIQFLFSCLIENT